MRLAVAAGLAAVILLERPLALSLYTIWAVALPLFLWGAWPFHRGLFKSLRRLRADSDMLVSVSLVAAFAFSTAAVFFPERIPEAFRRHHLVPMSCLIVLTIFGRWLETLLTERGGEALGKLMRRVPRTARVFRDGRPVTVPSSEVSVGDHVLVRPGEQLPFDGEIVEGSSCVDEFLWTGSDAPVEKAAGSRVYGGTQNKNGDLTVSVSRVGRSMALTRLVESVLEGLSVKAEGMRVSDRLAGGYVPALVMVAVASGLLWSVKGPEPNLWYAFAAAALVLVACCPWVMGLSVPIALAAGMRQAALRGIRIRNPALLQTMRLPNVVVLNKKGVLTRGRADVAEVICFGGRAPDDVVRWAAMAECRSGHPFADALRRAAAGSTSPPAKIRPRSVETYPGRGVAAMAEGRKIMVGSLNWLAERGITTGPEVSRRLEGKPQPVTGVAVDGRLAGIVLYDTPLRPGAGELVRRLEGMGIQVMLASGDRKPSVQQAADEAGIKEVHAEALEDEKLRLVTELQSAGRTVVMVGDGVQDAAALSRADLGVALAAWSGDNGNGGHRALGAGIDVAAESADIVVSTRDLESLVAGIGLSIRIRRVVRENLMWAFGVHGALIPVAAGALYLSLGVVLTPALVAGAALISLGGVIINSVRRFEG